MNRTNTKSKLGLVLGLIAFSAMLLMTTGCKKEDTPVGEESSAAGTATAASKPEGTTGETPIGTESNPGTTSPSVDTGGTRSAGSAASGSSSSASNTSASVGNTVDGSSAKPGTPDRPSRNFEPKELFGTWVQMTEKSTESDVKLVLNSDMTYELRRANGDVLSKGPWKASMDQLVLAGAETTDSSGGRDQFTVAPDGKSIYNEKVRFERRSK